VYQVGIAYYEITVVLLSSIATLAEEFILQPIEENQLKKPHTISVKLSDFTV
jgi:hypothetical protein